MLVNSLRDKLGTVKANGRAIVPSGRLWPNGEFSLGYARVGDEVEQENEWTWANEGRYLAREDIEARLTALEDMTEAMTGAYAAWAASGPLRLSLSSVCDSHKPTSRAKQGLKGMTGTGMKMVRSGAYLLEKRLGREDCTMITLTVPTLGRADRVRVAKRWGSLTNRLVQYLTRALVKAGRTPAIIGCVEIQSGRLEKYREGYLHLHLVLPAHANVGGLWAIQASGLRSWWKSAIERVIGKELAVLPRVETAIVQKSVEGYLGKYLSKGTGSELQAFIDDLGPECVPAQWWFASARMKEAIRNGTKTGRNAGAILDSLVNYLLEQGTGEGFEYIRHIDCVFDLLPVTVGYVGRLSPQLRDEVFAMLDK